MQNIKPRIELQCPPLWIPLHFVISDFSLVFVVDFVYLFACICECLFLFSFRLLSFLLSFSFKVSPSQLFCHLKWVAVEEEDESQEKKQKRKSEDVTKTLFYSFGSFICIFHCARFLNLFVFFLKRWRRRRRWLLLFFYLSYCFCCRCCRCC